MVSVYAGSFLIVPLFTVKKETRSLAKSEDGKRGIRALTRKEKKCNSHLGERENERGTELHNFQATSVSNHEFKARPATTIFCYPFLDTFIM